MRLIPLCRSCALKTSGTSKATGSATKLSSDSTSMLGINKRLRHGPRCVLAAQAEQKASRLSLRRRSRPECTNRSLRNAMLAILAAAMHSQDHSVSAVSLLVFYQAVYRGEIQPLAYVLVRLWFGLEQWAPRRTSHAWQLTL